MKIKNLLYGFSAALLLTGCQMLEGEGRDQMSYGQLQLMVEKNVPVSTKADQGTDVSNFKVTITDKADFSDQYTVATLPSSITLPVGAYQVQASSPETFQKKMSIPYFQGEAEMNIVADMTTQTLVSCKQLNSRIQVNYGEQFQQSFKTWTITIDDGGNTVLLFDNSGNSMNPVYWQFESNVKTLRVNITAEPQDGGNLIKGSMTITKADAIEHYDDDNEYYAGGDAIVLNFGLGDLDQPVEPDPIEPVTSGNGTLSVTVKCTFDSHEDSVYIPVVWEGDDSGESGEGDAEPEISIPTITFTSESVTASAAYGGPKMDATIQAEAGLRSVIVKASSTGDFQAAMEDLQESGLNLLTGHELVGDSVLPELFESLGVEATTPNLGDKEFIFNIANFYQFLGIYGSGDTTFSIIVEDLQGQTASGSVLVKITD